MAGQEGTKFQINYKLSDGTLINIYATSVQELETALADVSMNATNIKATGAELGAGSGNVAYAAAALGGTPVAAPATAPDGGKLCKHGAMSFKTGTSAKGAWQGWMCAAPKGALDKCETIWVR